jgi:hypothetical protein
MNRLPVRQSHYAKMLTMLRALARASVALVACFAMSEFAAAQSPSFTFRTRSYINPFPQTDRYQLHVLGDYLASGLANGLNEAFDKDGTIKINTSTKWSAGLARPERTNWPADIEELGKGQPIHIAVLMMGINDIRNINDENGTARWGTEEWRDAYSKQVDLLIKALQAKNIAVYWVGMPIMAKGKTSEAMALINDILRERSYINGTKFIDTWSGFTDQLGGFSSYGPDLTGQNKRLREPDGISFTARGNRKLANYVEVILRRDLAAARRERNISLAGDEQEQANLVPKADSKGWAPETGDSDGNPSDGNPEAGEPDTQPAMPAPAPQGDQNAEAQPQQEPADGQTPAPAGIGPQPALSVFASGYSPPGETIIGDITEGVTGLATVSPLNDLNTNFGERRLPVTERLYYRALVKGEPLKPKPGRADDFRWPRG